MTDFDTICARHFDTTEGEYADFAAAVLRALAELEEDSDIDPEAADWAGLAMAALDQAGLSLEAQRSVAELVARALDDEEL